MGAFDCPNCRMVRHIDESDDGDPRKDCCWFCRMPVPYTEAKLKRMRDYAAEWEGT